MMMKRYKIAAFAIALMLLLPVCAPAFVQAADGKVTIAVTEKTVKVGQTVTVTLTASGPNNEKASADMIFTFNTATFSYVSCGDSSFTGGPDGTITGRAGSVSIKLQAIAAGDCRLKVSGSNGTITATGEALSSVTAAGVIIKAAEEQAVQASSDSSLSSLSLSSGELSPAFSADVTSYSASVSNDITSLEVSAVPSHSAASISTITGNQELIVGSNLVQVTVAAQDGSTTVYQIDVTREEASETQTETETVTGDETEDAADQTEYWKNQYLDQYDKYQALKSSTRKVIAILIIVLVVLVILLVNLLIFRKNRDEDDGEDVFPETEEPGRRILGKPVQKDRREAERNLHKEKPEENLYRKEAEKNPHKKDPAENLYGKEAEKNLRPEEAGETAVAEPLSETKMGEPAAEPAEKDRQPEKKQEDANPTQSEPEFEVKEFIRKQRQKREESHSAEEDDPRVDLSDLERNENKEKRETSLEKKFADLTFVDLDDL